MCGSLDAVPASLALRTGCQLTKRTSDALKARCSTMCATPRSCSSSKTLPTFTTSLSDARFFGRLHARV